MNESINPDGTASNQPHAGQSVPGSIPIEVVGGQEQLAQEPLEVHYVRLAGAQDKRADAQKIRECGVEDPVLLARADAMEAEAEEAGDEAVEAYFGRLNTLNPAENPDVSRHLEEQTDAVSEKFGKEREDMQREHEAALAALKAEQANAMHNLDVQEGQAIADVAHQAMENLRQGRLTPKELQAEDAAKAARRAKELQVDAAEWGKPYIEKFQSLRDGEAIKLGVFRINFGFTSSRESGEVREGTAEYDDALEKARARFDYVMAGLGVNLTAKDVTDSENIRNLEYHARAYAGQDGAEDELATIREKLKSATGDPDLIRRGKDGVNQETHILQGDGCVMQAQYIYYLDGGSTDMVVHVKKEASYGQGLESELFPESVRFDNVGEEAEYNDMIRAAEHTLDVVENGKTRDGNLMIVDPSSYPRIDFAKARPFLEKFLERVGARHESPDGQHMPALEYLEKIAAVKGERGDGKRPHGDAEFVTKHGLLKCALNFNKDILKGIGAEEALLEGMYYPSTLTPGSSVEILLSRDT